MLYSKYLKYFETPRQKEDERDRYKSFLKGMSKFLSEKHNNVLIALSQVTEESHFILYKYRNDPFIQRILIHKEYDSCDVIFLGYLPIFLREIIPASSREIVENFYLSSDWKDAIQETLVQLINREIEDWKTLKEYIWTSISKYLTETPLLTTFKVLIKTILLMKFRYIICFDNFLPEGMSLHRDLYTNFLDEYEGPVEIKQTILTGLMVLNQSLFRTFHGKTDETVETDYRYYRDFETLFSRSLGERLEYLPNQMHLGIIMDGNRRWGCLNGFPGHFFGSFKTEELLRWIIRIENINELTLYCLSIDNVNKRSAEEIMGIEELLHVYLEHLISVSNLLKKEFEIIVIGEVERLGTRSIILIEELEKIYSDDITSENLRRKRLNLAIAYDPVKDSIIKEKKKHLRSEIDFVIRCGDVMRTSGFFPLNTIYAEWIFLPLLWPDMTFPQLIDCLRIFGSRIRRFGL